jgi:hypothetical protein
MNGGFDRPEGPGGVCMVFSDDLWEEYALGRPSEIDCKPLEEHLLICADCQDRLAEADEYIQVAKAGAALTKSGEGGGEPLVTDFETRRRLSKPADVAVALV